jgi:large subunit ribosomal protein L35
MCAFSRHKQLDAYARRAAQEERGKSRVMPKMKTNKTAAKRFKVSGSGRVRRPKAGGNHGLINKSRKRLRRLRNNDMVPKTLERKIKRLLPYD